MLHGSPYFSPEEFACKDGCGASDVAVDLIMGLHMLRRAAAVPFKITSGVRCQKHNTAVKGGARSTHMPGVKGACTAGYEGQGRACDVDTTGWNQDLRSRIAKMALDMGMRVGIANTFLHFDVEKAPHYTAGLWLYGGADNSSN